jgi:hypothetical protein
MKRLLLLSALLLAASACSTTPETGNANSSNAPANTNANANTTATPKAETSATSDTIIAKEKEIWDKIKTKNPDGFGAMLTDDFIYISTDGVYDKAGTVNGIKGIDATEISFSDWKAMMLDKDLAVVTYKVTMKGTSNGQPIPEAPLRASSAWVNRGGTWLGVYHQETVVKDAPMPQTASSPQAAAKPTPAAESKPAETTADAVANEKMVWDAIQKKDYDRFASYLSDNSIEVEETGVYDKPGSVKGVSMLDASKATLSDFKAMKLDDDASLVTYLVKIPVKGVSPLGERHSTIWTNKDGKWLAAFHEGTSVTPPPKAPAKK